MSPISCLEDMAPLLELSFAREDEPSDDEQYSDHADGSAQGTDHRPPSPQYEPAPKRHCVNPAEALPKASPSQNVPRQHRNRRRKRDEKIARDGHQAQVKTVVKVVQSSLPLPMPLVFKDLPAAHGGYVATNAKIPGWMKKYEVRELLDKGFRYIDWDGQ